MVRKTFAIMSLLALLLVQLGGAVSPVKAAQCSAQQGELLIEAGQYKQAIQEFTCVINAQPTEAEGYRGRIEAQLVLGRYSDALGDCSRITALVTPVHPDAQDIILSHYTDRLAAAPQDIHALTGASFMRWCFYQYNPAIHLLNQLLDVHPNSVYGNLFRGSSRLLQGVTRAKGVADLEYALALAPQSADVRFIIADAYTYGLPDPQRAFAEASLALDWGLDTPRVHAILAASYNAFGNQLAAADHIQTHIEFVTTEWIPASPILPDTTFELDLVPGRTYKIPVSATAGQTISIATSSPDFWDTILVLLAPDGTPVVGSDDANAYFAAIEWNAGETGTYLLQVTSFESVSTGVLVVTRD